MVLKVLFEQTPVFFPMMKTLFFLLQYTVPSFLLFVVMYLKLHCFREFTHIHTTN